MFKREIRAPICALFFISLGGLLLHLRIHPPAKSAYNLVPAVCGGITTFVLPFLFNDRRTVAWAYMLNLAAVIVGAVGMAYFSATHWEGPVTLQTLLLKSTLPDILVLCAKLPIGHQILRYFRPKEPPAAEPGAEKDE